MKICQSPCRKYERVRAMRRRETGTMHILDKKCNFCLIIKQKWVNLYSIHAAIEFPMFFGAISFMEGCIFEFVEIFSSLCYPSLSRIGKTSLFFPNTHKCEPLRLLNPHNMWIDVYLLSVWNGKLILSDHICMQIQMKLCVGFQGSEGFHLSSIKFQTRYEKSMLGQIGEGVDSSSAK